MAQHTQGPWVFSATHPQNACADVYADDGCTSIATCYGGDDAVRDENGIWGPQPTRDANARLIAAAPELLAALTECLPWVSGNAGHMSADKLNGIADSARAALAKATAGGAV